MQILDFILGIEFIRIILGWKFLLALYSGTFQNEIGESELKRTLNVKCSNQRDSLSEVISNKKMEAS